MEHKLLHSLPFRGDVGRMCHNGELKLENAMEHGVFHGLYYSGVWGSSIRPPLYGNPILDALSLS